MCVPPEGEAQFSLHLLCVRLTREELESYPHITDEGTEAHSGSPDLNPDSSGPYRGLYPFHCSHLPPWFGRSQGDWGPDASLCRCPCCCLAVLTLPGQRKAPETPAVAPVHPALMVSHSLPCPFHSSFHGERRDVPPLAMVTEVPYDHVPTGVGRDRCCRVK